MIPLGWIAHTPVFADESSISVISRGPRRLVLNVTAMGERMCLTSAHFPHQGRPEDERTRLAEALEAAWKQAQCGLLLMGCDANGRIPTWYRNVTGDRLVGDPDDPGFALCELAALHDCWLPSKPFQPATPVATSRMSIPAGSLAALITLRHLCLFLPTKSRHGLPKTLISLMCRRTTLHL